MQHVPFNLVILPSETRSHSSGKKNENAVDLFVTAKTWTLKLDTYRRGGEIPHRPSKQWPSMQTALKNHLFKEQLTMWEKKLNVNVNRYL